MLDARGHSNYLHASDPDPLSIAATQRLTAGSLGQQVARIGTFFFLLTPVWRMRHALVMHRTAVDGMCKQAWTGLRGVLFAATSIVLFHGMTRWQAAVDSVPLTPFMVHIKVN